MGGNTRVTGLTMWQDQISEVLTTAINQTTSGGGKGGSSTSTTTINNYAYYASWATLLCAGEISSVLKIKANGKLLSPEFIAANCTIYLGTEAQTQNATMVALDGATDTPAYRGIAYIFFNNVLLTDFGNRIPEISAIVSTPYTTVGSALTYLLNKSQLTAGQWSIDPAISGTVITGAAINELSSILGGIQVLSAGYEFIATESDAKIKFIKGRSG